MRIFGLRGRDNPRVQRAVQAMPRVSASLLRVSGPLGATTAAEVQVRVRQEIPVGAAPSDAGTGLIGEPPPCPNCPRRSGRAGECCRRR